MKFKLDLIREIQAEHAAQKVARARISALLLLCYGLLTIVLIYGAADILHMRSLVMQERGRLERVKAEYQRYKASEMIVSKADVELLDGLQNSRIFWTKKLLVMARFLPEDYWITKFEYDKATLTINGYGYISSKQDQLITLHDYLNILRTDSSFADIFHSSYLTSTIRNDDEQKRTRASFSIACVGGI